MKMMKLATGHAMPFNMPAMLASWLAFGGVLLRWRAHVARRAAAAPVDAPGRHALAQVRARSSVKAAANKAVATLRFNSQAPLKKCDHLSLCAFCGPGLTGPAEYARHDRAGQGGRVAIERGARLFRFLLHARARRRNSCSTVERVDARSSARLSSADLRMSSICR